MSEEQDSIMKDPAFVKEIPEPDPETELLSLQTGIRPPVILEIRSFARKHGVKKVVLFGSRARGDHQERSDIDLAVFGGNADLFRLDIEEETSTLLKYDVVEMNQDVNPGLREQILKDGKTIYEEV